MALGKFDGVSTTSLGKAYNKTYSSIGKICGSALPALGAWSTTGSTNYYRERGCSCGTTAAAIVASGFYNTSPRQQTEKWSGTAWSSTTNNTSQKYSACIVGTSTNAFQGGGTTASSVILRTCHTWNGTSWATSSTMVAPIGWSYGMSGITSAALAFGGTTQTGSGGGMSVTEKWGGSTWQTTSALNLGRYNDVGCGTTSSSFSVSGNSTASTPVTNVEKWTGNTWSTTIAINRARDRHQVVGDTSACIAYCGNQSGGDYMSSADSWDGSAWSTLPSMSVGRRAPAGCGDATAALCMGGLTALGTNWTYVCEKWAA